MIVVFTDEAGDDVAALDETVDLCRKLAMPRPTLCCKNFASDLRIICFAWLNKRWNAATRGLLIVCCTK